MGRGCPGGDGRRAGGRGRAPQEHGGPPRERAGGRGDAQGGADAAGPGDRRAVLRPDRADLLRRRRPAGAGADPVQLPVRGRHRVRPAAPGRRPAGHHPARPDPAGARRGVLGARLPAHPRVHAAAPVRGHRLRVRRGGSTRPSTRPCRIRSRGSAGRPGPGGCRSGRRAGPACRRCWPRASRPCRG